MKKRFVFLLLFLFPALLMAQSTITTVADGNWSDPAIWDSGVPGENDTAAIEHTVAVDDNVVALNVTIASTGILNYPTDSFDVKLSDGGSFEVIGTIDSGNSRVRFLGGGEFLGNPTVWGMRIAGGVVLTGSTITDSFVLDEGGYIAQTPGGDPITDESDIPNYTDSIELDFEGEHTINGPDKGWGNSTGKNPKSILVNTGANVTINTPRTLDGLLTVMVLGELTTNGNLTVTSNGNLFNNWVVNGNITMTRTLNGSEGFRLLSSPVDVNMNDLFAPVWTQGFTTGANTSSGDKNIWQWNNSSTGTAAGNWSELSEISSQLDRKDGALIYIYKNDDVTDEDPGSFPKELSVTGAFPDELTDPSLNPNIGGFTLLGNPYVGPMTVDPAKSENISNILYIYDPNHTEESGDWKTYDLDANTGDWDNGVIGPMQAFFVETTAADPVIEIDQTETRDAEFFGKSNEDQIRVQLKLEGQNLKSTAWLRFSETGKPGFDNSDARKLTPLSADFAMLATESEEGILLNMNHLPIVEEEISLPLITESTRAGTYTLSAPQFDIPSSWSVRLKDQQTGEIHSVDPSFNFSFSLANPATSLSTSVSLLTDGNIQYEPSEDHRFELLISAHGSTNIPPNSELPGKPVLHQNYPNPFNPSTVISYQIPVNSNVKLKVFDMLGRRVSTLVDKQMQAGSHSVEFDGGNLASGVYVYRLQAGSKVLTRKLTLIK